MTVIEVRGRGGQLLERHRSNAAVIRIGRAFDNDLILEDPYVSPHHLRLTAGEHGWLIEDLASINGIRQRERSAAVPGDNELQSGDRIRIGHTALYVFDDSHPVPEALELDGAETRLAALGNHNVWPLLLLTVAAALALLGYWNNFQEFKPVMVLTYVSGGLGAVLVVAAFWALVSRLVRHRAMFFAHLSLWLLFILAGMITSSVAEWIAYNAGSAVLENVLQAVLAAGIIAAVLWCSLLLATNLQTRSRMAVAIAIALAIISYDLLTALPVNREFSPVPGYYAQIKHPALLFASPRDETVLLETLPRLFDAADAEVLRLKQEEEDGD